MNKTIIKWMLLYFGLYSVNNIFWYNHPENQQHPMDILSFFHSTIDTTDLSSAHSRLKINPLKTPDYLLRIQLDSLMTKMARIECPDGDINVINHFGYMGKYQFGTAALRTCGIHLTSYQFRRNPRLFPEELQDKAFILFCQNNRNDMKPYIKKYAGRRIKNIKITETSIVAASHGGTGRVITFLKTNGRCDPKDGNGTPISYYLKKFEHIYVNFDKALTII